MTDRPAPVPLMNAARFISCVNDYAAFHHMVAITDHARGRMEERGITRRMVLRVLERGTLQSGPTWNAVTASWEGKIKGTAAGVRLTVVCAIRDGRMTITVITAHKSAR